jgi:type I restriction enzyme R subunit
MYLDKVTVAHNLLQAIARVNRVAGAAKEKGFVVDYVGIGHHLKRAIDNYDEREQKEVLDAISFPEDELRELQTDFKAIMALLEKHGLTDLNDHDAFFDLFYDEEIRFEFILAYRKLTRSLDLVFPAKEALQYIPAYNVLTEISALAARHLDDQRLSMKGIPPKLRALTDQYLASKGVEQKVKPISILDEDFEREVVKHKRIKTKAAAVEHAIRHHLDVELDDDPELQASFAAALSDILQQFKDNWQKIYEELERLRKRIIEVGNEPTYGLHKKTQMPFFRMFKTEIFGATAPNDDQISLLVELTQEVFMVVQRELKLASFWESVPARNKLRAEVQQILVSDAFRSLSNVVANRNQIISRVMEIAEKNNERILYAS